MDDQFPKITIVHPGDKPPVPIVIVTNNDLALIHDGTMTPTPSMVRNMAYELRKWRGVPNPESL
jgi:hypothetical protein